LKTNHTIADFSEKLGAKFGHNSKKSEGREEAEVLVAQAQPLQDLRAATGFFTEVRHLPSVFPWPGAAGRDSRCFEVVLVGKSSLVVGR
jgi:hypothetical protein